MKIYTHKKIKEQLSNIPKIPKTKKDFTWHYLYIFHYLKTYKMYNSKYKDEEFVPINVKKLRKIISYDLAPKLLKNLVDSELLLSDFCYRVGDKSKCYKINQEFPDDSWILEEIEDRALNKKLTELFFSEKIVLMNDFSSYGKVTKNLEKLTIDKVESLNYVNQNITEEFKKNSYKMAINMFETKFSTKDDLCNRLHNNLTNLPSTLRKFVTCEGKTLFQVDIKCSQPTFLGLYLLKKGLGDKEEILRYLELCKSGELYSQIIDSDKFDNRKDLKQALFKNCFFNKNYKKLNVVEIMFQKMFPTIFEQIRKIKLEDFKNLSVILQREESYFIFDTINYMDFDVFTIHDSIVSTEENILNVKNIMEANFLKIYDFYPNLTVEKC